jgi:hypothetical protein
MDFFNNVIFSEDASPAEEDAPWGRMRLLPPVAWSFERTCGRYEQYRLWVSLASSSASPYCVTQLESAELHTNGLN